MNKKGVPSLRHDFNGAADRLPQFGVHPHADIDLYFREVEDAPQQKGFAGVTGQPAAHEPYRN